ncbi:MAG TPA: PQQ-binding-like beta-propeller repeat protein, partial [Pirellulaceae bacterium]
MRTHEPRREHLGPPGLQGRGTLVACAVLGLFTFLRTGMAENWTNWRGPSGQGVAAGERYPVTWGPEENIAWRFELPGHGGSTPAVWENYIFVTCADGEHNVILALDRQGQERWKVALGQYRPGKHPKATGANPSPVTDGQLVFAYFKSGDLACLDVSGRVAWKMNLQKRFGEDTLWWDLGTSPVLTTDAVIVACQQSGPSYVVALAKATGEVLWKHDRLLPAPDEAAQSYSTPMIAPDGRRELLIVAGADHVTAHSLTDGAEIWRVGGLNPGQQRFFRSIASPVLADGRVLVPYARGATLTAVELGGRGDVTETHVAWTREDIAS